MRTLVFCLAFPVFMYGVLWWVTAHYPMPTDAQRLQAMLPFAAVACAAAWLVSRPKQITWFRWPWWSYGLLGAGFLVRAWFLPAERALPALLFYLVVVSLQEEFLFRGCVEEGLADLGKGPAMLVAGIFFGIAHAPLGILRGAEPLTAVISNVGMGLVAQWFFRYLREKGGLALPVLVHGLMDYVGA